MTPSDATTARPTALVDLARQFGGAETRVLQLLRALPDTFAVCLDGSGLHRRCVAEGLPVVTLRAGRADPLLVPRLAGVLRGHRVVAVDTHGVAAQLWALPAAALAGIDRRIATVHSQYRAEQAAGSARGRAYDTVLRTTRVTATGWIAVSRSVRDDLCRVGLPPARIAIVRSGVDVDAGAPSTEVRRMRRAALGYRPDHLVLTAVGRLHPGKGHRVLLDAVARLAARMPHLRLLVVGDGSERAALARLVARRGLTGRVTFTGFRDDVAGLLHLADVFCLPTDRTEGLPYAALEAAAAGLPVVASRLGGIADVFADGDTALLVAPGDSAALAHALARVSDPALRRALGGAARTMARDELSTTVMAAATAAVQGVGTAMTVGDAPPRTAPRRARRIARAAVGALSTTPTAGHAVGALDRIARRSPSALPVLMYHRVAPADGDHGFDPVLLSATPEAFDEQITRLTRTSNLLTLTDVLEIRRGDRPLPERAVLLTFDDAYAGFARWAWPVLRAHRAPCVVFVPTAYPGAPARQFWWEDLHRALHTTRVGRLDTPAGVLPLATPAARTRACRRLSAWIKATDHRLAMAHLDGWLDALGRPAPVATTMDWRQLRELSAAGVDIAPHSRTHAMLDRLPAAALAREIHGSIDDLRTRLGRCPPAFCFPAGQRTSAVRDELVRAGVEVAFSTRHGVNRRGRVDWLDLQRIDVSAAMPAPLLQLALQPWAEPLAARLA